MGLTSHALDSIALGNSYYVLQETDYSGIFNWQNIFWQLVNSFLE